MLWLALLLAAEIQLADVYYHRGNDGTLIFSNKPSPGATKISEKTINCHQLKTPQFREDCVAGVTPPTGYDTWLAFEAHLTELRKKRETTQPERKLNPPPQVAPAPVKQQAVKPAAHLSPSDIERCHVRIKTPKYKEACLRGEKPPPGHNDDWQQFEQWEARIKRYNDEAAGRIPAESTSPLGDLSDREKRKEFYKRQAPEGATSGEHLWNWVGIKIIQFFSFDFAEFFGFDINMPDEQKPLLRKKHWTYTEWFLVILTGTLMCLAGLFVMRWGDPFQTPSKFQKMFEILDEEYDRYTDWGEAQTNQYRIQVAQSKYGEKNRREANKYSKGIIWPEVIFGSLFTLTSPLRMYQIMRMFRRDSRLAWRAMTDKEKP